MKHLLIASLVMFAIVFSSQTTMQNKTVAAKFDSTYAGPYINLGEPITPSIFHASAAMQSNSGPVTS